MSARIVVINPNSSEAVTGAIDRAVAPLRMAGGPSIECVTLADGPPGIETQAHVEQVVQPTRPPGAGARGRRGLRDRLLQRSGPAALREATARPVLGIAECGMLFALTLGERFGIVSILAGSVPRHLRYVRQLGLAARFAGDLPIGLGVAELADEGKTLVRLSAIGSELRDHHGADVLVLGCAGMAQYRHQIEHAIGLPVVDPTQAAVTMAIGAVRLAEAQAPGAGGGRLSFRLAGLPFLEGQARQLEAVVGAHVAVAEQAADRRIVRRHPQGRGIDDAVAHVQPQHLAKDDVALAAGLQRHQAPALEMHGRLGDARTARPARTAAARALRPRSR